MTTSTPNFFRGLSFSWSLYFRGLFIDKFGFHFSREKVDMKFDGGQDEESLGSVVHPATDTMSIFKA